MFFLYPRTHLYAGELECIDLAPPSGHQLYSRENHRLLQNWPLCWAALRSQEKSAGVISVSGDQNPTALMHLCDIWGDGYLHVTMISLLERTLALCS